MSAFISIALNAAAVSVEHPGFPVPPPNITILLFFRFSSIVISSALETISSISNALSAIAFEFIALKVADKIKLFMVVLIIPILSDKTESI